MVWGHDVGTVGLKSAIISTVQGSTRVPLVCGLEPGIHAVDVLIPNAASSRSNAASSRSNAAGLL
jgi:hypothetical protein